MNIFVLDLDYEKAAAYHCNKHVVKMVTETAQILSTALNLNGIALPGAYKPTHTKHPCVQWAAHCMESFLWTAQLGVSLCKEYTKRYGKVHASQEVIAACRPYYLCLPNWPPKMRPQCMPEIYRGNDVVYAYRSYYLGEKLHFAKWPEEPHWVKEYRDAERDLLG